MSVSLLANNDGSATLATRGNLGVAVPPASSDAQAVRLDQSYIANDFRLSLTTAVPVTTADVTAAATLYCVPYVGNRIGLWNGTAWVNYSTAEMSLALGTLASATIPNDVFCYLSAGVPTLEKLAWTSTTARATALAYQNGILVKSGDSTRRYLGSFAPTATTTTEDSAANRFLWNYYNRIDRPLRRLETTASWTPTALNVWELANAAAANKLNFFIGVVEDEIDFTLKAHGSTTVATYTLSAAIGLNSVSAPATGSLIGYRVTPVAGIIGEIHANLNVYPTLGINYVSWLQHADTGSVTTWNGVATTVLQSGLIGRVKA